jgi:hypothetical protein
MAHKEPREALDEQPAGEHTIHREDDHPRPYCRGKSHSQGRVEGEQRVGP